VDKAWPCIHSLIYIGTNAKKLIFCSLLITFGIACE
jgi:hypothetical protein